MSADNPVAFSRTLSHQTPRVAELVGLLGDESDDTVTVVRVNAEAGSLTPLPSLTFHAPSGTQASGDLSSQRYFFVVGSKRLIAVHTQTGGLLASRSIRGLSDITGLEYDSGTGKLLALAKSGTHSTLGLVQIDPATGRVTVKRTYSTLDIDLESGGEAVLDPTTRRYLFLDRGGRLFAFDKCTGNLESTAQMPEGLFSVEFDPQTTTLLGLTSVEGDQAECDFSIQHCAAGLALLRVDPRTGNNTVVRTFGTSGRFLPGLAPADAIGGWSAGESAYDALNDRYLFAALVWEAPPEQNGLNNNYLFTVDANRGTLLTSARTSPLVGNLEFIAPVAAGPRVISFFFTGFRAEACGSGMEMLRADIAQEASLLGNLIAAPVFGWPATRVRPNRQLVAARRFVAGFVQEERTGPNDFVVFVGHSYGGNIAYQLARESSRLSSPAALLAFDPIDWRRCRLLPFPGLNCDQSDREDIQPAPTGVPPARVRNYVQRNPQEFIKGFSVAGVVDEVFATTHNLIDDDLGPGPDGQIDTADDVHLGIYLRIRTFLRDLALGV